MSIELNPHQGQQSCIPPETFLQKKTLRGGPKHTDISVDLIFREKECDVLTLGLPTHRTALLHTLQRGSRQKWQARCQMK